MPLATSRVSFDHHVHAVSGWIDFATGNPPRVRIVSILPLMLIGGLLGSPMTKYRQNGQACDAPSALGAGVLSRHDAVWSAFFAGLVTVRLGFGLVPPIVADIESMAKHTHRLAACLWSRPVDPEPCARTIFRPDIRACLSGDEQWSREGGPEYGWALGSRPPTLGHGKLDRQPS